MRQLAKDTFGGGAAKEEPAKVAAPPKAEEPAKAAEPPKAEEPAKAAEPPKAEEPVAPPAEPEPVGAGMGDPPPEKKKKKKSSVKLGKKVGDKVTVEGFEGEGTVRYKGKWQHGKNEGKNAIGVEMDDKVRAACGNGGVGRSAVAFEFTTRFI